MRITLSFFVFMSILGFVLTLYEIAVLSVYPSQFIYAQDDLFMDFFNTAYQQAFIQTPYSEWKTVYAPFTLGFAEAVMSVMSGNELTEFLSAKSLRDQFYQEFSFLLAAFLASAFFFANITSTGTAEKVGLILIGLLSMPVLFLFERGNLLFLALPLLFIFCDPNTRLDKFRVLALLVSIKIYFLLFVFCFNKKELNQNSIANFFLTLAIVNLSALVWFPSDFGIIQFLNNLFSFDKTSHPFIEIAGFNYSLPTLVSSTLNRMQVSMRFGFEYNYLFIQAFHFISLLSPLFWILVFWSVKKANSFIEKFTHIALFCLICFGDAGGYLGILLIPIMLNYYRAGQKGLFALTNLCLLNIHLGDVAISSALHIFYSPLEDIMIAKVTGIDAYSFFRPLFLLLLLFLLIKNNIETEIQELRGMKTSTSISNY